MRLEELVELRPELVQRVMEGPSAPRVATLGDDVVIRQHDIAAAVDAPENSGHARPQQDRLGRGLQMLPDHSRTSRLAPAAPPTELIRPDSGAAPAPGPPARSGRGIARPAPS